MQGRHIAVSPDSQGKTATVTWCPSEPNVWIAQDSKHLVRQPFISALPPEKQVLYQLNGMVDGPQVRPGHTGDKENNLPL